MKPAPFVYHAPRALDQAIELLTEHEWEARPLAGGQSLVPAMNFRLAQPAILVDLNRIEALRYIEPTDDGAVRIGAMTLQRDVEHSDLVARRAPLVHRTMPWIAHAQIRNRGTFGGSLAHADPAAELPAVALVCDAVLVARSADGERRIEASEFFLGLMTTALMPGELLTAVEIPAPPPRSGHAFTELARRHGDYAIVGVGAAVTVDEDGACASARVGLLSVGETPARFDIEALVGARPDPAALDRAIEGAAAEVVARLDPPSDLHASAAYRGRVAQVLVRRALAAAFADAARVAAPGFADDHREETL